MSEVKRYAMPIALGGRLVVPQEAEKGLWCMYQDYAKLESENNQLRTERDRLRVTLRRVCSHEEAWDRLPMSLQDEAAAALTQREGGEA